MGSTENFDLMVIGCGPAGEKAGAQAAYFGKRVAVCHGFGLKYKQRVASLLPMGIYTIPEISAAGETEESCKEQKIDYVVGGRSMKTMRAATSLATPRACST